VFTTHRASRSSAEAGLSLLTAWVFEYGVFSYQNISNWEPWEAASSAKSLTTLLLGRMH